MSNVQQVMGTPIGLDAPPPNMGETIQPYQQETAEEYVNVPQQQQPQIGFRWDAIGKLVGYSDHPGPYNGISEFGTSTSRSTPATSFFAENQHRQIIYRWDAIRKLVGHGRKTNDNVPMYGIANFGTSTSHTTTPKSLWQRDMGSHVGFRWESVGHLAKYQDNGPKMPKGPGDTSVGPQYIGIRDFGICKPTPDFK